MGKGWHGAAVAAIVASVIAAACSSGSSDGQLVATQLGPDQVAAWRRHWNPPAEDFWAAITDWQREISLAVAPEDAPITEAAAPTIVATLDRFSEALGERAVPGDMRAGADRLRSVLVTYRALWVALGACGPVPTCQEPLIEQVKAALPQVRSAQFDLRPR